MNTTTTVDLCCTKQNNEDKMPLLQNITVLFSFLCHNFSNCVLNPAIGKPDEKLIKKNEKNITKKQQNCYKFVRSILHNSGNDAITRILPRLPLEHVVDFV